MEPLIVDVENEIKFISREIEILKRKKRRIEEEKDSENIDSHIKAIALTMQSIYSGYEKIIEMLVKGLDGDVPAVIEYHSALLKRATYEIPDIRPPIISEGTFILLNALRAYRHKLRRIYTYLISHKKILHMTEDTIKSFDLFERDWGIFKEFILRTA